MRHDELATAKPPTRSAATALPGREVRLQEPQARCVDSFSGHQTWRLLGRPWVRLVRRVVRRRNSEETCYDTSLEGSSSDPGELRVAGRLRAEQRQGRSEHLDAGQN